VRTTTRHDRSSSTSSNASCSCLTSGKLDQLAAVAEFDTDPEAVKTIVAAAKAGRFEHTVQRLRDDRTDTARRVSGCERSWSGPG